MSHSFWRLLFSPLLSSITIFISIPYFLDNPFCPHWYYFDLITFLAQKETVTAITELIHCNQPVPVPPLPTCLKELISVNTLYPGLVGNLFIFSLVHSLALFRLVHRSHMVPISLLIQSSFILQLVLVSVHQYAQ